MDLPHSPPLSAIATEAGVSTSTASRALHGGHHLRPETVRRVTAVARRLGYQRNPVISEVMRRMRGRHGAPLIGNIAYLTWGPTRDGWREHLTFLRFFEGAQARAQAIGFSLEEIWAGEAGLSPRRLQAILRARGIVGVVVAAVPGAPEPPRLDWSELAAVKVGVPVAGLALPNAGHDQFRGMVMTLDQLKARGYRRLGLVLQTHQNVKTAERWLAPLVLHQQQRPSADRVAPLITDDWSEAEFARWFKRQQPDVVIGLRKELIAWLGHLGQRVPADVGFAHLDRCTESGDHAGIDQRPAEIGAAAVDLVIRRLNANERGLAPAPWLLANEGVWVDGPTLRAPRG
jgi:LacI family transcriptional regulator